MSRFATLSLLAVLALAVVASGCKGSKRNEALTGDNVIRASNEAGIEIAISNIRQHRRHLVLNVDITNNGEAAVELRNPGDVMRGFTIESEGRSVSALSRRGGYWGPWVGYRPGVESSAAGVMELPPGATAGLELHFRWPRPYPDRHDYPWTLTVSQMYKKEGGAALPPIVHSEP
ncbi:MAG: hypothetical protein EA402_05380 [Planctomycetota bacterium]|nr:MAG: hypothetical protein EA402_05380 [Planctomycetota bacterium]